jgi:hypothetical protein
MYRGLRCPAERRPMSRYDASACGLGCSDASTSSFLIRSERPWEVVVDRVVDYTNLEEETSPSLGLDTNDVSGRWLAGEPGV